MSHRWSENTAQRQQKPTHLSVGSLSTNASTLADSTISFGSGWTGENGGEQFRLSHFPRPPSGLPESPILTELGETPPLTPRQHEFGSRSIASTPRASEFPISVSEHPRGSLSVQTAIPPIIRKRESSTATSLPAFDMVPPVPPLRPNFLKKEQRASVQDSRANTSRNEASLSKHSPSSTVPPSSYSSWHDGASAVTVDSTEERLLTTSFITSLLSEVADQDGNYHRSWENANKLPSGSTHFEGVDSSKSRGETSPIASRDAPQIISGRNPYGQYESTTSLQQSSQTTKPLATYPPPVPGSLPSTPTSSLSGSNALSPPVSFPSRMGPLARHSRGEEEGVRDGSSSRRASAEYSDTLHSEDGQIHSVVRTASLAWSRSSNGPRAIGVAPAYTLLPTRQSSNGDNILSPTSPIHTTASTPPPLHNIDSPSGTSYSDANYGVDQMTCVEDNEVYLKSGDYAAERMSAPFSPALPSTAGISNRFDDAVQVRPDSQRRKSVRSTKSFVSSLVSRISRSTGGSTPARERSWLRWRPLPPLPPLPPIPPPKPYTDETRKHEEAIPLPQLMKRAGALADMLDTTGESIIARHGASKGYRGLGAYTSDSDALRRHVPYSGPGAPINDNLQFAGRWSHLGGFQNFEGADPGPHSPNAKTKRPRILGGRRRTRVIIGVVVSVVLLIVGITVGLVVSKEHKHSSTQCQGNFTGASCDLDATCVCTSSVPGQCNQLAQALLSLIPTVNNLFSANFTPSSLSNQIFNAQGSPVGNLCTKQALLVDVAPGLDQSTSPNRTQWAQAALLWNLALSANLTANSALQDFVTDAHWSSLQEADGPVADASGQFLVTNSGYEFDFASQNVTPPNISFQTDGQVSSSQVAEVSVTAGTVLDRMYSFALASSTQRQKSLNTYWQSVLQQQAEDLPTFLSAVQSAPFLLPFDATSSPGGQSMADLLTNSTTAPFPPPLACYPSLSSSQLQVLNTIETTVFGLSPASTPSSFVYSCFPDRPIYGVVDLLRLRLPFNDNTTDVAKQAAVLNTAATSRAVVYSGELLSAFPGASTVPNISAEVTDPREYGTVNHINHVILNYLTSISNSNVTLAMDFVQFILQGSQVPPPANSSLFSSLSSIPVLEFAVFGSITPPDIASSVSSFSTPSGSLFFGSPQAESFRTWALTQPTSSIAWTELSSSAEVVREGPTTDEVFESVWTPASELIQSGQAQPSDVGNVTQTFAALGKFSP